VRSSVIAIAAVVVLVATIAAQSPPAHVLSGTIVDTAIKPLSGATLTLTGPARRNATSDKDGKFAFGELPLGDYEVRVDLAGFSTVIKSVTLGESAKDSTGPVLIPMRMGTSAGQVTGIVRDAKGVLLASVSVDISSPDFSEKYRSTTTGSDGVYRFSDLPDGTYSVTFTREHFWTRRLDNVVLTNGSRATVDTNMAAGGDWTIEPIIGAK